MIDLRSDTVTKPSKGMLNAMMSAEVGDDVFGEDPTINALEEKCADMFGMDDALFCPSGTMANQIGMGILTKPYEEIICYEGAHIYKYEGGGLPGNSGLSVKLIKGDRGRISAEDVKNNINPDDQHFPTTSVVALENTVNKGGGAYYTIDDIKKIHSEAGNAGLKLHLDGARLFNAIVETHDDPRDYGGLFDTISICLSKGLGAPVGSVLMFNRQLTRAARRRRKVFGGAMRQAGFLAAAGIYALDNNIDRLKEDHENAKILEDCLSGLSWVDSVLPVDTNIVIFKLSGNRSSDLYIDILHEKEIEAVAFGPKEIRFVTHLDFTQSMIEQTISKLKSIRD